MSALREVTPESFQAMFNEDPALMTDETVAKIRDKLRADRLKFVEEDKTPKGKKVAAATNLSLDDLGI